MSNEQAICPECNEPCGPLREGAKVYHWSCLAKKFKSLREEWEKETLITCSRCKREVYEVEAETGLCLVCVGKELEL